MTHPPSPDTRPALATFLGTGRYEATTYQLDGQTASSRFACVALATCLRPREVVALLTREAAAHDNWRDCSKELRQLGLPVREVAIPDVADEGELWRFFDILAAALPGPGTPVVLDVTHGFRSLPLVATLAASFLRASGLLDLQRVVYGAYRPGAAASTTPLLDLTPLISLMDWAGAATLLLQAFDGRRIADLATARQRSIRQGTAQPQHDQPSQLGCLGSHLRRASVAYRLGRAQEFVQQARNLPRTLDQALPEAERWLPPLRHLFGKVRATYPAFPDDLLAAERELIRIYCDHGQTVQAIGLAREWLVNWAGRWAGWPIVTQQERNLIERALGQLAGPASHEPADEAERLRRDHLQATLPQLAEGESLASLWDGLTSRRNDLQHFGYNQNPARAIDLERQARTLVGRVLALPLPDIPESPAT